MTQHNFGHIGVDLEESFVFVVLEGETVVYQKKIIVREGRLNELVQNQKKGQTRRKIDGDCKRDFALNTKNL